MDTSDVAYPVIGETTTGLAEHLVRSGFLGAIEDYEPIRRDALAIIKRCRKFSGPDGRTTGLVVGYVQSGKTVSMTAVSALARDNGCRIIIVLAGVTTILLDQNEKRFTRDLRGAARSKWRIYNSDRLSDHDSHHLREAVAEWQSTIIAEEDQQTSLFMVLKNHAHLERMCNLLRSVDLHGVPALIIDDEADQAGLNTSLGEEPSTNYRKIEQLRSALPHHTYLQYTATPQAPLLIQIADLLSPEFAELVEPGKGYTGGKTFFGPDAPNLVRNIPEEDQHRPGAPPTEVPDTLIEALQVFFMGAAVAAVRNGPTPRSMLVHPSPRNVDHTTYLAWISEIVKRWTATLRSPDLEHRNELIDEFRQVYDNDLAKTDLDLPPFDVLIPRLMTCLSRANLKEVNSIDGSEVNWDNSDTHILVGGEKLNRGFTVEGLTVTYMPRGAGGWNADTLQQRARFFGYKKKYLGLCRLYLHPDVTNSYREYVEHEEDIRKQLAAHRGQPLKAWRRAFFLSSDMKPTRRNVLRDPSYRVTADKPWFLQRHAHVVGDAARAQNAKLIGDVEKDYKFAPADGYFKHTIAETSLADFYKKTLVPYAVDGDDLGNWYGQLLTLSDLIDKDPDARVVLVRMNGERERKLDKGGIALQQGASSAKVKDGAYPGDAKIVDASAVTVQLHWINVKDGGPRNVPAIALHIPTELRKDVFAQLKQ